MEESNGAGVAVSGTAGEKMTPRARMCGLVNSFALTRELVLERSAVDDLAQ